MTANLRVAIYPADLGGCGHYRLIWPARALAAQGADIDLVLPDEPPDRQLRASWVDVDVDGTPTLHDVVAPDADVVVLQRPLLHHFADAVPMLQAKGVRVVVEVDDDFDSISPRNIAWSSVDPARSADRNRDHLRRACAQADLVTVSTPALAKRYGAHGRVAVLPNLIPRRYLDIVADPHDGVFVGWSGSMATHRDDLQVVGGGVAQALRATGAGFAVIGDGRGVQRALGLGMTPRATKWLPIDVYPTALAQLDVGIVPLESTPFNEAKSWLKGLEMAAVGVPFVASPTSEYRTLERLGAGHIADRPNRWATIVRTLATDVDLRAEVAGFGRDAASQLTIEEHCGRWFEAWESAVNTSRAA